MLTLLHQPFCPHSRFARIALAEYGVSARMVEERFWERRESFLLVNPAATTPVLVVEGGPAIPGAQVIAEYLEETRERMHDDRKLMPRDPGARAEVRRLSAWFHDKFFAEVSGPLINERIYKRYMTTEQGGGSPDANVLRAAKNNIRYHLAYIGWLMGSRNWLAGEALSYADLAAAAHLSVADYLGDVPWHEDETAKNWYARLKSRPSFRSILTDTLPWMAPSENYTNLDF